MPMYNLAQKLIVELIGTFTVVFISVGAICADQYLTAAGKSGVGLLGIAAAYGLAVAIMVTAMAHISGGHYNPAVTIGFWVTQRLGTVSSILYCAAQLVGATAAAYAIKFIVPETVWEQVALGTPALAPDFTRMHGMALEAITTFFLVLVVFATAVDAKGAFNKIAGFAAGLTVTIGVLVAYPFSGAALNPARAFGPALASRHWTNHGVYWVGPLFGGVIAGFIYDRIFLGQQPPS